MTITNGTLVDVLSNFFSSRSIKVAALITQRKTYNSLVVVLYAESTFTPLAVETHNYAALSVIPVVLVFAVVLWLAIVAAVFLESCFINDYTDC